MAARHLGVASKSKATQWNSAWMMGEEWLALRKAGHKTPAIAIWQNLQDPAGNLWREYVNGAYSDPACEHTAKWSRSYPLLTLLAGGEQTMN